MDIKAAFKKSGFEIALILVAFLFYGWYAFSRGLWEDELAVMADVMNSPSIFALVRELQWELHAPGCWLLIYVFHKLSWDAPLVMRLPSIFAAALGLVALFRISRRYLPPRWSFIYGIFCMTLPTMTTHATEIRPHIFLFAFGSWILYFLHEASFSSETDGFYRNIEKAVLALTVGALFHFGSFFILIALFVPFVFFHRDRFRSSNERLLETGHGIIYLVITILLFSGLYLFSRNLPSVLWGNFQPHLFAHLRGYAIQSFAYHHADAFLVAVTSVLIILFHLIRNEYEQRLKHLAIMYTWALTLIAAIHAAGLPSSRSKYSLYLIPIATLLLIKGVYLFKGQKIAFFFSQLLLCIMLFLNITHRDIYSRVHRAKAMVMAAQEILNLDSESKLLLFGDQRNLSYYFEKFPLPPDKIASCDIDENCVLRHLQEKRSYRLYLLTYHGSFKNPELQKLYTRTIVGDTYGRLIEVDPAR